MSKLIHFMYVEKVFNFSSSVECKFYDTSTHLNHPVHILGYLAALSAHCSSLSSGICSLGESFAYL